MAHPYDSKARKGTVVADARYGKHPTPNLRSGPLIKAAEDVSRPEENYNGAPTRQISESGKVRK